MREKDRPFKIILVLKRAIIHGDHTIKSGIQDDMYKIKDASPCLRIAALLTGFMCIFLNLEYIHASDCEVREVRTYEKEQDVIVTDWFQGVAYRRYQTEVYPCAQVTVRSNYQLSISTEDIEITATFTDRSTQVKKFDCKEKQLEYGDEYSCGICFESTYPIDSLKCTIR